MAQPSHPQASFKVSFTGEGTPGQKECDSLTSSNGCKSQRLNWPGDTVFHYMESKSSRAGKNVCPDCYVYYKNKSSSQPTLKRLTGTYWYLTGFFHLTVLLATAEIAPTQTEHPVVSQDQKDQQRKDIIYRHNLDGQRKKSALA